jgi:hypothetical protein
LKIISLRIYYYLYSLDYYVDIHKFKFNNFTLFYYNIIFSSQCFFFKSHKLLINCTGVWTHLFWQNRTFRKRNQNCIVCPINVLSQCVLLTPQDKQELSVVFFMSNDSDVTHNPSEMHWFPKRRRLKWIKTVRRIQEMDIYLYGIDADVYRLIGCYIAHHVSITSKKIQTTYQRRLRNFWSEISIDCESLLVSALHTKAGR